MRSAAALLVFLLASTRSAIANCQLGGTFCGDPVATDCKVGSVCFPPYRSCTGCTCTTTNEGHTCLADASQPGAVGSLLVAASTVTPGSLDLSWAASCRAGATDYAVYEGQLGTWYSHEPKQCTSGGALSLTLVPSGGDRYYLVAPLSAGFLGSFGTATSGAERPDGLGSCGTDRALAPCP